MKERPIIFNAEMVRAVLAGRKTQTRRPFPVQPHGEYGEHYNGKMEGPEMYEPQLFDKYGDAYPGKPIFGCYTEDGEQGFKCPFGQPGDRLWVRETCKAEELESGLDGVRFAADDAFAPIKDTKEAAEDWLVLSTYRKKKYQHGQSNTVPSIHMPRWASRILLEITDIRVERVQDISEADAAAEGSECIIFPNVDDNKTMRDRFRALWNSVYGSDAWTRNDWVWVIDFKRIEDDA